MSHWFAKSVFLPMLLVILLCSGCSLKYTMEDPALSNITYASAGESPITLAVIDERSGDDTHFAVGKIGPGAAYGDISSVLQFANISEPISYFAGQLQDELQQRGLPVTSVVGESAKAGATLAVRRYQIVNYRATGFSPWESGHVFDGVLKAQGREKRIRAYMYNGKTPVWSMDEIQDPCFNTPASILIQDVATKINQELYDLHASDAKIDQLVGEIDKELEGKPEEGPFWKVLELGYSNNANAIAPLKRYAKEGDDFFKSCAISALGIVGTEDEIPFLKQIYTDTIYNEKYMAVKALGDIGGDAAMAVIKAAKEEEIYEGEGGLKTAVDLYLE